jgi:NADPH:quinone reductase-like Zn-dependent oxidoreductase
MLALRRGGVLVHYGGPQSMWGLVALIAKLLFFKLWPNGKDVRGYGTHRVPHALRCADWSALFGLLAGGAIDPKIAAVYPLREIVAANEHLERGAVVGTIVIRGDA